jgi:hypothetical protein
MEGMAQVHMSEAEVAGNFAAAYSWSHVQSRITLSNAGSSAFMGGYTPPIPISDSTNTNDFVGLTNIYGGDCSSCFGYLDQCSGSCWNAASVLHADILLNPTIVSSQASAYSPIVGYSVSTSTVAQYALMHELGHALRLGDVKVIYGRCSEVSSIMYTSASVLFGCGVHQPTTTCDGNALNSTVYPAAPPTCTPLDSEWCYDVPPYSCS